MKLRHLFALALAACLPLVSVAQNASPADNFGFERMATNGLPEGWAFNDTPDYKFASDDQLKHAGERSLRITCAEVTQKQDFAYASFRLPANFEGYSLVLSGWIRAENVEMAADLGVQIENGSGTILERSTIAAQRQIVRGTSGWQRFSTYVQYDSKARSIVVSLFLRGTGTVWFDDLELTLDGKPLAEAPARPAYGADTDTEFDRGSGITTEELAGIPVTELARLGKLWGFLKYYHPAVASGQKNWDYELFRVIKKLAASPSPKEAEKIYTEWIASLGPVEAAPKQAAQLAGAVKLTPDLSWIDYSKFSKRFVAQLHDIANAKRPDKNYYAELMGGEIVMFTNESKYETDGVPDAGQCLLSLYRHWNVVQYYSPYRDIIGEDWDGVLAEFIPEYVNAADRLSYIKAAMAFTARLNDGHAQTYDRQRTYYNSLGNRMLPVKLVRAGDRIVVEVVYATRDGATSPLKPGDVITAVNGLTIEKMLDGAGVGRYVSASNRHSKLMLLTQALTATPDSTLRVTLGDGRTLDVPACSTRDIVWTRTPPADPFRMITPGVAYMNHGTFSDSLTSAWAQFKDCKALILDLRQYPRHSNNISELAPMLMPDSTAFALFTLGSITTPGLFALYSEEGMKAGEPNPDYFKGKVVAIVDDMTMSYLELCAMFVKALPRGIVVGTTTAGADGNNSPFVLPGGVNTSLSVVGVYYPDGGQTQRIGIVPDVRAERTPEGIAAGRDELLERAVELARAE